VVRVALSVDICCLIFLTVIATYSSPTAYFPIGFVSIKRIFFIPYSVLIHILGHYLKSFVNVKFCS